MPPISNLQKQRRAVLEKGREALKETQDSTTVKDTAEIIDKEVDLSVELVGDYNDPDQEIELEGDWCKETLDLLDSTKKAGSYLRSVYTGMRKILQW